MNRALSEFKGVPRKLVPFDDEPDHRSGAQDAADADGAERAEGGPDGGVAEQAPLLPPRHAERGLHLQFLRDHQETETDPTEGGDKGVYPRLQDGVPAVGNQDLADRGHFPIVSLAGEEALLSVVGIQDTQTAVSHVTHREVAAAADTAKVGLGSWDLCFYLRRSSSQVYKCPMFFINEWTFWLTVQTFAEDNRKFEHENRHLSGFSEH